MKNERSVDWKSLTNGFITKSVDAFLWSLFFVFDLSQRKTTYEAISNPSPIADSILERFQEDRTKSVIQTARRHNLITSSGVHGKSAPLKITKQGLARLHTLVPYYNHVRTWDNTMHIITYDIAEKQRKLRNKIRIYLKILGGAMLQKSVWISPYNPTTIIKKLVQEHRLHGSIIVSALGKNGYIGDESMPELVIRVYQLRQLNKQYESFVRSWDGKIIDSLTIAQYLAILRKDPQLPFKLLPTWWKGRTAYKLVKPYLKRYYAFNGKN